MRRGPAPAHALQRLARENPHCAQVTTPLVRARYGEPEMRPPEARPVYLGAGSELMRYARRPDSERSPLHYGQLKLFIGELWLLTRAAAALGDDLTVLYAGAAPGTHIPLLASLFPACRFILYDPAPFCRAVAGEPRIEAHQEPFTDAAAAAYGEALPAAKLVFISDIRTGKSEECVQADMALQKGWVRALRPALTMLKFRLPWGAGATPYLDGDILLQAYAPLTSTECRLVVTREQLGRPDRAYDNVWYEQACAFHNTVGRVRTYAHGARAPGLDACHDCATLVAVVGEYLRGARPAGAAAGAPARGDASAFICTMFDSFEGRRDLTREYLRSSSRRR